MPTMTPLDGVRYWWYQWRGYHLARMRTELGSPWRDIMLQGMRESRAEVKAWRAMLGR